MKQLLFLSLFLSTVFSEPPQTIPWRLYNGFTMDGKIPVIYNYRNDSYSSEKPLIYSTQEIDQFILKAHERQTHYYGVTDTYLYQALDQHRKAVEHKNVALIGSAVPWYESILLSYSAFPTTIEYNKIISEDPRIEVMTVEEFDAHPKTFDAIVSISSIEHDGLARYGDPLNPTGDLQAMEKAKKMLKKEGLLFLSVPVGKDCLIWNLHRVYGKLRLKALLHGWRVIGFFGFTSEDLDQDRPYDVHQPVFVLKPL